MNSKNDWIRDFLGVTAWHKAGYTGKRGLTASGEDFINCAASDHAAKTLQAMREIAPDRRAVHIKVPREQAQLEDIRAQGVDVMFASLSTTVFTSAERELVDTGLADRCILFVSAGNKDTQQYNLYMRAEKIFGVGAVKLVVDEMRGGVPAPGAIITPAPAYYIGQRLRRFCRGDKPVRR